jgi:uncharacterized UBP type Zn finger protein
MVPLWFDWAARTQTRYGVHPVAKLLGKFLRDLATNPHERPLDARELLKGLAEHIQHTTVKGRSGDVVSIKTRSKLKLKRRKNKKGGKKAKEGVGFFDGKMHDAAGFFVTLHDRMVLVEPSFANTCVTVTGVSTQCAHCGVSTTPRTIQESTLPLELPAAEEIDQEHDEEDMYEFQDLLDSRFAQEQIDGYRCTRETCPERLQMGSAMQITALMKPLKATIMHLKRYTYCENAQETVKRATKVHICGQHRFPVQLSGDEQPDHVCVKNLTGVIVHDGFETDAGHYISYVKGESNVWRVYDDTSCDVVSFEQVQQGALREGYLFFFDEGEVVSGGSSASCQER